MAAERVLPGYHFVRFDDVVSFRIPVVTLIRSTQCLLRTRLILLSFERTILIHYPIWDIYQVFISLRLKRRPTDVIYRLILVW